MILKSILLKQCVLSILLFTVRIAYAEHDIIFCGERIPVTSNFVAEKLMNVIRAQIPGVNLPQLRKRVELNFPVVEYYLRATGLPDDFKYLAIVESGFQNLTSIAGARGFWQLMPATARELGLIISDDIDERDNIYKSTYAACKTLASNYLAIRKKYGISSWVLTAAAYNHGIGNISKAMNRQGRDYFSMDLNQETALYVYKIIAVKELFEYPELYMKDFGYNVFNSIAKAPDINLKTAKDDTKAFSSMEVKISKNNNSHPDSIIVSKSIKPLQNNQGEKSKPDLRSSSFKYVAANIKGRYNDFADGNLIGIELLENLELNGSFNRKGNLLQGKGWIIGDRIFVDLGYDSHDVTLIDIDGNKGIPLNSLKNNQTILLKITHDAD